MPAGRVLLWVPRMHDACDAHADPLASRARTAAYVMLHMRHTPTRHTVWAQGLCMCEASQVPAGESTNHIHAYACMHAPSTPQSAARTHAHPRVRPGRPDTLRCRTTSSARMVSAHALPRLTHTPPGHPIQADPGPGGAAAGVGHPGLHGDDGPCRHASGVVPSVDA